MPGEAAEQSVNPLLLDLRQVRDACGKVQTALVGLRDKQEGEHRARRVHGKNLRALRAEDPGPLAKLIAGDAALSDEDRKPYAKAMIAYRALHERETLMKVLLDPLAPQKLGQAAYTNAQNQLGFFSNENLKQHRLVARAIEWLKPLADAQADYLQNDDANQAVPNIPLPFIFSPSGLYLDIRGFDDLTKGTALEPWGVFLSFLSIHQLLGQYSGPFDRVPWPLFDVAHDLPKIQDKIDAYDAGKWKVPNTIPRACLETIIGEEHWAMKYFGWLLTSVPIRRVIGLLKFDNIQSRIAVGAFAAMMKDLDGQFANTDEVNALKGFITHETAEGILTPDNYQIDLGKLWGHCGQRFIQGMSTLRADCARDGVSSPPVSHAQDITDQIEDQFYDCVSEDPDSNWSDAVEEDSDQTAGNTQAEVVSKVEGSAVASQAPVDAPVTLPNTPLGERGSETSTNTQQTQVASPPTLTDKPSFPERHRLKLLLLAALLTTAVGLLMFFPPAAALLGITSLKIVSVFGLTDVATKALLTASTFFGVMGFFHWGSLWSRAKAMREAGQGWSFAGRILAASIGLGVLAASAVPVIAPIVASSAALIQWMAVGVGAGVSALGMVMAGIRWSWGGRGGAAPADTAASFYEPPSLPVEQAQQPASVPHPSPPQGNRLNPYDGLPKPLRNASNNTPPRPSR